VRSLPIACGLALAALVAGVSASRGANAAGPTATSIPTAIGAPVIGQRLTALHGGWNGAGTLAFHYQWYRCDNQAAHCSSIHGATAPSYRIVAADATHTIGLTVGATDTSGTASAYASIVGPVAPASAAFVSTVQPAATGKVTQGGTVQVDTGAWSIKPTAFTYSWLRCNANGRICTPIAGADAAGYTATAGDAGHALVAAVTATAGAGRVTALSTVATAATATSPPTGGGPAASIEPAVTGSNVVGGRLIGSAGTWSGSGTISYAYQWYRCDATGAHCSSIHGATVATYALASADAAHTIGLTVNATDKTGVSSAYASLVGPVAAAGAALVATAQPAVTGTARAGASLTVSTGTWSQAPTAYAYAWQRCNANGRICTAITGATAAKYTVTAADSGHRLLAIVEAASGSNKTAAFSRALRVL
jgi:fibronectin-binding autotransporter adhesin